MAVGRWCTDEQVIDFDEDHGIEFPSISGDAGGTGVFNDYGVTSTPTLCIIHPDRTILEKIIWPPTKDNIVQKLTENGGITQECSTGITENDFMGDFSVHPNPASSDATLNFELYENEKIFIEIIDLLGKHVVKVPDHDFFPGINEVNLNLSNLNRGIYFIKISNPNSISYTQKLIVR